MKSAELLRRLAKLARSRSWPFEWRPHRGKGSHGLLIMSGRRAIFPDLKSEIAKGTYHAILGQLGIDDEELRNG